MRGILLSQISTAPTPFKKLCIIQVKAFNLIAAQSVTLRIHIFRYWHIVAAISVIYITHQGNDNSYLTASPNPQIGQRYWAQSIYKCLFMVCSMLMWKYIIVPSSSWVHILKQLPLQSNRVIYCSDWIRQLISTSRGQIKNTRKCWPLTYNYKKNNKEFVFTLCFSKPFLSLNHFADTVKNHNLITILHHLKR